MGCPEGNNTEKTELAFKSDVYLEITTLRYLSERDIILPFLKQLTALIRLKRKKT